MKNEPFYSLDTAISTPKQLILEFSFWAKNRKLIGFLLAGILIFGLLWQVTFPPIDKMNDPIIKWSSMAITFFIWRTLLLGIWNILRSFARLEIETAFAYQAKKNFEAAIRDSQSQVLNLKVNKIATLLPANPNLTMTRLFEHIISEAKSRKFESSLITMQPYKDESLRALFNITSLQKLALQLGILGTFIGLILAFQQLGTQNTQNLEGMIEPIQKALEFSFNTSISGLEVSIILGLFISLLNEKQQIFFEQMEKSTDSILTLARRAENKDDYFVEFNQIKNSINQLSDSVEAQSLEVKDQTRQIRKGIGRLANAKSEFDGFLKHLTHQEADFVKEVKEVYAYLSPKTISDEYKNSLQQSTDLISTAVQTNLNETLKRYKELNVSLVKMNENLREIEQQLEEQIKFGNAKTLEARNEIYEALEKMSKAQSDFIDQVSANHLSEEISRSILKAGDSIANQYRNDLQKMLPHVQMLSTEIKQYNSIVQEEVTQRTQRKILVRIKELFQMLVVSRWHSIKKKFSSKK